MQRQYSRMKSMDYFKKLPQDFTEATVSGASLSIAVTFIMFLLFIMELTSFLSTRSETQLVVNRSHPAESLPVRFNISFPMLSCQFINIDVSDTLGMKRVNLTSTITKTPVDRKTLLKAGNEVFEHGTKNHLTSEPLQYSQEELKRMYPEEQVTENLDKIQLDNLVKKYQVVMVNFYASWCKWCQLFEPIWLDASVELHRKYPEWDGRIRLARVDCAANLKLCQEHQIEAYPMVRVFRQGKETVNVFGQQIHTVYSGERSVRAITAFGDNIIQNFHKRDIKIEHMVEVPQESGCNIAGQALVKKVPGSLHFAVRSKEHTFDHDIINTTHIVHQFYFGRMYDQKRLYDIARLHPGGLIPNWHDKLQGSLFASEKEQTTHEHFLQVVLTSIYPLRRRDPGYDAYEYIVHTYHYEADHVPTAKFSYDISPVQVIVKETPKQFYKFLTSLCAIIGGVYTIFSLVDGVIYQTYKFTKKVDLGKQY